MLFFNAFFHFTSHLLTFSDRRKGPMMHFNGSLLKKGNQTLGMIFFWQNILREQRGVSKHLWAGVKLEIFWPLEQSGPMLVLINPCLPLRSKKSSLAKEKGDCYKKSPFPFIWTSALYPLTWPLVMLFWKIILSETTLHMNERLINTTESKSWTFLPFNACYTRNDFLGNFFHVNYCFRQQQCGRSSSD